MGVLFSRWGLASSIQKKYFHISHVFVIVPAFISSEEERCNQQILLISKRCCIEKLFILCLVLNMILQRKPDDFLWLAKNIIEIYRWGLLCLFFRWELPKMVGIGNFNSYVGA